MSAMMCGKMEIDITYRGQTPDIDEEATEMKKGNVYENKMGSVLKITSIKNDMVYVTYNGKKKAPVAKAGFERWISFGVVREV